jgi:hypothetical protein
MCRKESIHVIDNENTIFYTVQLQFESICSDIDFFLPRNIHDFMLFLHASKKMVIEIQGIEQWTID